MWSCLVHTKERVERNQLRPVEKRRGRISTSAVEGIVSRLIGRRIGKGQHMCWTKRAAHLLLQVRRAVLNNELLGHTRRRSLRSRLQAAPASPRRDLACPIERVARDLRLNGRPHCRRKTRARGPVLRYVALIGRFRLRQNCHSPPWQHARPEPAAPCAIENVRQ
jgi:hypothetical protein